MRPGSLPRFYEHVHRPVGLNSKWETLRGSIWLRGITSDNIPTSWTTLLSKKRFRDQQPQTRLALLLSTFHMTGTQAERSLPEFNSTPMGSRARMRPRGRQARDPSQARGQVSDTEFGIESPKPHFTLTSMLPILLSFLARQPHTSQAGQYPGKGRQAKATFSVARMPLLGCSLPL